MSAVRMPSLMIQPSKTVKLNKVVQSMWKVPIHVYLTPTLPTFLLIIMVVQYMWQDQMQIFPKAISKEAKSKTSMVVQYILQVKTPILKNPTSLPLKL